MEILFDYFLNWSSILSWFLEERGFLILSWIYSHGLRGSEWPRSRFRVDFLNPKLFKVKSMIIQTWFSALFPLEFYEYISQLGLEHQLHFRKKSDVWENAKTRSLKPSVETPWQWQKLQAHSHINKWISKPLIEHSNKICIFGINTKTCFKANKMTKAKILWDTCIFTVITDFYTEQLNT